MAFSNGNPSIIQDGLVFTMDAGNILSYPGSGTKVDDIVLNCTGALDNDTYSPDNGACFTFTHLCPKYLMSKVWLHLCLTLPPHNSALYNCFLTD